MIYLLSSQALVKQTRAERLHFTNIVYVLYTKRLGAIKACGTPYISVFAHLFNLNSRKLEPEKIVPNKPIVAL